MTNHDKYEIYEYLLASALEESCPKLADFCRGIFFLGIALFWLFFGGVMLLGALGIL